MDTTPRGDTRAPRAYAAPAYEFIAETHVARLIEELAGDTACGARFLRDFVCAWDGRMDRLTVALDPRDDRALSATLLSLRSSSAMLGALVLGRTATEVLQSVRSNLAVQPEQMSRLRVVGSATCREMSHLADRLAAA